MTHQHGIDSNLKNEFATYTWEYKTLNGPEKRKEVQSVLCKVTSVPVLICTVENCVVKRNDRRINKFS